MAIRSRSTRRRFLQGMVAAGAATIVSSPSQRCFSSESPNGRPVFATIGLRNQGWAITNQTIPLADFAALADVDENVLGVNIQKTTEKQGRAPEAYKDYRRILDRKDIDAVMIATPDHWHTKISVEAMLAGKDVYCEKPLTLTIDEGKRIEQVVKQTGRVFQVGTMQRTEFNQRFVQAVALVKHGRIGSVKRVTCGIGGAEASPVIPIAPVPDGLDWDLWVGPAPMVPYRELPRIREGYGGGVPHFSNGHHSFRYWHDFAGGNQPISDVWSHNRMLEICHLANIAMRLGRELSWDPIKREIIGDPQANSFLARESRKGYEISR